VVIAQGSISEMALHFIEKYEMMALKIMSKWELRRLCTALRCTALVRLGPATPEEMGHAGNNTSINKQLNYSSTVQTRSITTLEDVNLALQCGSIVITSICTNTLRVSIQ
jgi:chaperonin GroEL (HSP60 family)